MELKYFLIVLFLYHLKYIYQKLPESYTSFVEHTSTHARKQCWVTVNFFVIGNFYLQAKQISIYIHKPLNLGINKKVNDSILHKRKKSNILFIFFFKLLYISIIRYLAKNICILHFFLNFPIYKLRGRKFSDTDNSICNRYNAE